MIQQFLDQPFLLSSVRETLGNIRDVERTVGRLSQVSGNARDVVALRLSLESLPELKEHLAALAKAILAEGEDLLLNRIASGIRELPDLVQLLSDALVEEPPALLKEGGMFREGYDPRLDELRSASRSGKDWIAALQQREIERTGIKSLKVRFNSVFGYFIEVTNSNLGAVPADYTRKQTTVERRKVCHSGTEGSRVENIWVPTSAPRRWSTSSFCACVRVFWNTCRSCRRQLDPSRFLM